MSLAAAAFLIMAGPCAAAVLEVDAGLVFDAPAGMDITYQIVPAYDPEEKVIALWAGEKLRYFMTVGKLPPTHADPAKYIASLGRELARADPRKLSVGRQLGFGTDNGLKVSAVEFIRHAEDGKVVSVTLVSHIVAAGGPYVSLASYTPEAGNAFEDSVALLAKAKVLEAPVAKALSTRGGLVGTWELQDVLPDGRPITSRFELASDFSFKTTATSNDSLLFTAAGVWTRDGDTLQWIYTDSKPPLPESASKDSDEILLIGSSELRLRSSASGKERVYRRK